MRVEFGKYPSHYSTSYYNGSSHYADIHCSNPYWISFKKESELDDLFPINIQNISDTKDKIAYSPVGFTGPKSTQLFNAYLDALLKKMDSENIVSLYLLGRPSSENNEGRTNYIVDIKRDIESQISIMKKDSRSRSRKLLNLLQKTHISYDKAYISNFAFNYSRLSKNFAKVYQFDEKSLDTLLQSDSISLMNVIDDKDQWLAGAFVGYDKNASFADYLYSCTIESSEDLSRLLLLHIFQELSNQKISSFFLGGGIKENDNLARFKLSMGGIPRNAHIYKIVTNQDKYKHYESIHPSTTRRFPNFHIQ